MPPASIPGQIEGDLYLDQSTGHTYKLGPAGKPVGSLVAIGSAYQGSDYGNYYGGLIIAPEPTGQSNVRRQRKLNQQPAGPPAQGPIRVAGVGSDR